MLRNPAVNPCCNGAPFAFSGTVHRYDSSNKPSDRDTDILRFALYTTVGVRLTPAVKLSAPFVPIFSDNGRLVSKEAPIGPARKHVRTQKRARTDRLRMISVAVGPFPELVISIHALHP